MSVGPARPTANVPQTLLDVRDLEVVYRSSRGPAVNAVRGVSFAVGPGEIFGLVGESGSGKSTVGLAVMGALRPPAAVAGDVRYRGEPLFGRTTAALRALWGRRLAIVFQNPGSTLNPVLRAGAQVMEVLQEHEGLSRAEAFARAVDLFRAVQLTDPAGVAEKYPHQLSGGQQQRVSIAMALACDPDLLVMDEPTTGLDVTTEARILDLVRSLRGRTGAAILYISHNLAVIAELCDRVGVMYAGELVESGTVREVFARPRHPYTLALLRCLPRADVPAVRRPLPAIEGGLPDPTAPLAYCQFAPRCTMAEDRCRRERPPLAESGAGRTSRCFFWQGVPAADAAAEARPEGGPGRDALGSAAGPPVLEGRRLTHDYGAHTGPLAIWRARGPLRALDDVSLEVAAGEALAVIGESGSGKTTLGRCLVGLIEPTAGEVRVRGERPPARVRDWPRSTRRHVQMVFQNPDLTLNPRRTVLDAVARPMHLFGLTTAAERRARAAALLQAVKLGARHLDRLPHQLSGGERQRVAIARAFSINPEAVVCDEPTSALDVSVQAAILNLLAGLQQERRASYVFISHDLSVVRHLADRVAVVYRGTIVEEGRTEDVFAPPHHPYTAILLSAVPSLRPAGRRLADAAGGAEPAEQVADALDARGGIGCPFHPRCPRKIGAICEEQRPPLVADPRGHKIACHIPRADLGGTAV
jgi:peptide/nickel transport system ATP-binding protein